jgi:hypothetical protein
MRLRRLLLGLCAVYLLIGPIGKQLFGARVPNGFQTWRMFAGTARDTCQIRVTAASAAGDVRVLELEPASSGKRWRVLRAQLPGIRRRICHQARRELGPGADVRLEARCGSRRRWVIEDDGSVEVCRTVTRK